MIRSKFSPRGNCQQPFEVEKLTNPPILSAAANGHMPPLATAALEYARFALPVIPLRPRGKVPLTQHGVRDASTNREAIKFWWRRWPDANIGIAVPNGYLVVDTDCDEALQYLKALDLPLPTTATARTARGRHFWYQSGEQPVRNAVGLMPGIDVRTSGGYVVAPPSTHPSGVRYRWLVKLRRENVAEVPAWLPQLLNSESRARKGRSAEEWLSVIATPVPPGRRNQSLAEVTGLYMRRLPARIAAEAAYCWAKVRLSPPLPEAEVWRTINSIAGRELRRQEAQR